MTSFFLLNLIYIVLTWHSFKHDLIFTTRCFCCSWMKLISLGLKKEKQSRKQLNIARLLLNTYIICWQRRCTSRPIYLTNTNLIFDFVSNLKVLILENSRSSIKNIKIHLHKIYTLSVTYDMHSYKKTEEYRFISKLPCVKITRNCLTIYNWPPLEMS